MITSFSNLLKLIILDQFYTSIPFDGRNSTAIVAIDTIDDWYWLIAISQWRQHFVTSSIYVQRIDRKCISSRRELSIHVPNYYDIADIICPPIYKTQWIVRKE